MVTLKPSLNCPYLDPWLPNMGFSVWLPDSVFRCFRLVSVLKRFGVAAISITSPLSILLPKSSHHVSVTICSQHEAKARDEWEKDCWIHPTTWIKSSYSSTSSWQPQFLSQSTSQICHVSCYLMPTDRNSRSRVVCIGWITQRHVHGLKPYT